MRLNTERDAIEFALTRSSLPTGGSIYRGAIETELERLKERLLAEELARTVTLDVNVLLRRAANEAVALAWLTPVPLLLLPVLFEEKALAARQMARRQALIRERSQELMVLTE
ncbi:MAG TPA: hypothetical protein PKN95_12410 [Verrucomicrobiota bacterium]|nr:hypothetical protein [Verrucomicrobiota bacterium]HNT16006.1 hypothetical protein [Verrucomicrobiota bacterium]